MIRPQFMFSPMHSGAHPSCLLALALLPASGCGGGGSSGGVGTTPTPLNPAATAPASAPNWTTPAPSSSSTGSYTIAWSSVAEATSYELQRGDSPGFTTSTTLVDANQTSYMEGVGSGTYYYRVRAKNAAGPGPWSTVAGPIAVSRPSNSPPVISSVTASPTSVTTGGMSTVTAGASDPDGDVLSYAWSASGGSVGGSGAAITWTSPGAAGSYSITVTVTDGRGGATNGSATVTVTGSPTSAGTLQFSLSNYSVSEGSGVATITVDRIGGTSGAVTVQYATIDGTAGVTADYTAASGVVSWDSGTYGTRSFVVTLVGDTQVEGDETFGVSLTNPTGGASLGTTASATVTIVDNDSPPKRVTKIAAGWDHSIALTEDGRIWAWGRNDSGQVGNGRLTFSDPVPSLASGLTGMIAIAGGKYHTAAVKGDGTVWWWGGAGLQLTPVQVAGLTGVSAVAAGYEHTVALKGDGTLWTWGSNSAGQLGDGTWNLGQSVPVQVAGLTGVTAVAAGAAHTVALKGDGTVWTWGAGGAGERGDGTWDFARNTPVQVGGLTGVTAVASGHSHTIAVKGDGTVWTWGYNNWGQLGDGTTTSRNTPVQVGTQPDVTAGEGGDGHTIVLKGDRAAAWGYNLSGDLGDGTTTTRSMPTSFVSGLSGLTAVAAGFTHSMALKGDGTAWTWGNNREGELGNGGAVSQTTPLQVIFP